MNSRFLLPLLLVLATGLAPSQQQQKVKLADSGASRAEFVSPDVHADRTVTFRTSAPDATKVLVHFGNKDYPMSKEENGVWSTTLGPVEPEIYPYHYVIDGAQVYAVIDGAGLDNSQVEVPGNPSRYDELQNVPHGTIVLHTYHSNVQGRERHLRVYLPPNYYSEPNRKFPVLYLFPGFDDIEWTTVGKVNIVLDNLIAQNKAVPMIIVMPFNRIYGENVAQLAHMQTAKTLEERSGLATSMDTIAVFEKELPDEIMPMIESDYRTYTDRDHRAIAGLSFGGGTAFGLAVRHLDMFAYLGEFATGTFGGTKNPPDGYVGYGPWDPDRFTPNMFKKMSDPVTGLKLFYMSCGEGDPRLSFQKAAYEQFKSNGVNVLFEALPGIHEFRFFRRGMADFATMIFK
jgi:enterochelin esterase family protein